MLCLIKEGIYGFIFHPRVKIHASRTHFQLTTLYGGQQENHSQSKLLHGFFFPRLISSETLHSSSTPKVTRDRRRTATVAAFGCQGNSYLQIESTQAKKERL